MYVDRVTRVISYHDTWISIDPIQGCPYKCEYCVLRHANHTGVTPDVLVSPQECLQLLLEFPYFVSGRTPLAIGNETDMLHPRNRDYLVELLQVFKAAGLTNSVSLITKVPLNDDILTNLSKINGPQIVFFLSYSGLGTQFEPNFTDETFRHNFQLVKKYDFPLVHFWRPLLPQNTSLSQIRDMLNFVSSLADASVLIGLKIHPELSKVLIQGALISIPDEYMNSYGEWIETNTINTIYDEAKHICPDYPLYRHTSCALANVLSRPNHTATVFRKDICLPSHCPKLQRDICEHAKIIPNNEIISEALSKLGRTEKFTRLPDKVVINAEITQEEFSFLLHELNCPIQVIAIRFENLYRGNIFIEQKVGQDSL
jgi:DNA repair photolyase